MQINKIVVVAICGLSALPVAAQTCDKSYGFQTSVNSSAGPLICDWNVRSFLNSLDNLQSTNPNYTLTSAASVAARFNDVSINLSYPANSKTLSYSFPQLGLSGTFTGATRSESEDLLVKYIQKEGLLGKVMQYQARNSSTSPIAGVGGAVPIAIAADFGVGFNNSPTPVSGSSSSGAASNNLRGVALQYGEFRLGSMSDGIKATTLPLSYAIRNDIDPRRQLTISAPITLLEIGDAKSYHAGLGLAYRLPINDQWSITPAARVSFVASVDRATASLLYSGSLSSNYVFPLKGFDLVIGNMVGHYTTGKFSIGDYSASPDLSYTATRNGIMISQPVTLGRRLTAEYSLIDTRYIGSEKPLIDNFQEVGITLGTNKSALDARSAFRAGITFTRGPSLRGATANLGYWF
ncbi:MAG: hypothetical protein NTV19_19375 [Burkholderiales bacterium]|nr:hypothetical protein [Burkholderiales bacterium]